MWSSLRTTVPADSCRRDEHALQLRVVLQGVHAQLLADARLLVAAERRLRVRNLTRGKILRQSRPTGPSACAVHRDEFPVRVDRVAWKAEACREEVWHGV